METPIFPDIRARNCELRGEYFTELSSRVRVKNPEDGQYYYVYVEDNYTTSLVPAQYNLMKVIELNNQIHQSFISKCYKVMHLASGMSFKKSNKCSFPRLEEKDRVEIKAKMHMPDNINSIL